MLLTQTLLYLPAQLLGPLLQFASILVWTHWLSPDELGTMTLVLVAQELIQLSLTWWSVYTIRYALTFADDQSRSRYQKTESTLLLASAALQALAAALTMALAFDTVSVGLVGASAGFIVTRSLMNHLAERARAFGKVPAYTAAQILAPLLGLALGIAGLAEVAPTAAVAIAGLAAGQLLVLPFLWRSIAFRTSGGSALDGQMVRAALAYGLPLLATGAVGWVSGNAIRLIVERLEGPAALGFLSAGWTLGNRLISVAAMLVTAASFPLAIRKLGPGDDRAASLAQVAQGGALLVGVLAPCTMGAILVGEPAVQLLVGPEFRAITISILPLAVLAGALRALHLHFADQVFLIAEHPRMYLAVASIEALATIALTWLGMVQGGLVGACLGCCAAYALGALVSFGVATIRYGMPLPIGAIAKICAATALMASLLRMVSWPNGLPGLILPVFAGGALYLAAVAVLFRQGLAGLMAERASRAG